MPVGKLSLLMVTRDVESRTIFLVRQTNLPSLPRSEETDHVVVGVPLEIGTTHHLRSCNRSWFGAWSHLAHLTRSIENDQYCGDSSYYRHSHDNRCNTQGFSQQ